MSDPKKTGAGWTAEKITDQAKIICGVKDFGMVSKFSLMSKIVDLDVGNQVLIRELYFVKPDHHFFKNWTDADRQAMEAQRPAPVEPPPSKGE